MRHPRAKIRDAIYRRLKDPTAPGVFRTAAEGRVFKSRVAPVDTNDDEELPAILVYSREDKRDARGGYGVDGADTTATSELRIVVEAIVRAKNDVDDVCDDLAVDIEAALEDWEIPGFEGATMRLGDSLIDVIADAGSKPVGAIGLIYHVWYQTPFRPAPDDVGDDDAFEEAFGYRPQASAEAVFGHRPGEAPRRIV